MSILDDAQHAWESAFGRDARGRPVPPRFHRLLFFDVLGEPDDAARSRLDQAFAELDERYGRTTDGLLSLIGWSTGWFERHTEIVSPVNRAVRMARFEDPVIDEYDGFMHLASDHEQRLVDLVDELFGEGPLDQRETLALREVRTGFVGDGLPRERLAGIDVPADSPLLLGFRSVLRGNQAPEENITILSGPFAGGTTAHVSRIELNVAEWHAKPRDEQSALLLAPTISAAEADELVDDARSDYENTDASIDRYDVIGHAQAAARARINDVPLINRRDFATIDDGKPGTHFLSLQRDLRDFNNTRAIMNGADAATRSTRVGPRHRNGINAFMNVTRRATYVVPPRSLRAFPFARGAAQPAQVAPTRDDVLLTVAEILGADGVPSAAEPVAVLREALDVLQQSRVTSLLVDGALGIPTRGRRSHDVTEALSALDPQLGALLREHFGITVQALTQRAVRLTGDLGRGLVAAAVTGGELTWRGAGDLRISGRVTVPTDLTLLDLLLLPLADGVVAVLPTYREGLRAEADASVELDDVLLLRGEQAQLDWDALIRRLGRPGSVVRREHAQPEPQLDAEPVAVHAGAVEDPATEFATSAIEPAVEGAP